MGVICNQEVFLETKQSFPELLKPIALQIEIHRVSAGLAIPGQ